MSTSEAINTKIITSTSYHGSEYIQELLMNLYMAFRCCLFNETGLFTGISFFLTSFVVWRNCSTLPLVVTSGDTTRRLSGVTSGVTSGVASLNGVPDVLELSVVIWLRTDVLSEWASLSVSISSSVWLRSCNNSLSRLIVPSYGVNGEEKWYLEEGLKEENADLVECHHLRARQSCSGIDMRFFVFVTFNVKAWCILFMTKERRYYFCYHLVNCITDGHSPTHGEYSLSL